MNEKIGMTNENEKNKHNMDFGDMAEGRGQCGEADFSEGERWERGMNANRTTHANFGPKSFG